MSPDAGVGQAKSRGLGGSGFCSPDTFALDVVPNYEFGTFAHRLEFSHELLATRVPGVWRSEFEGEAGRTVVTDTRIVAFQMLEQACPEIFGLADADPERAEESIHSGSRGSILDDRFTG